MLLKGAYCVGEHFVDPQSIRECPPQFENRIMARVYVRSITRSMYRKAPLLLAGTGVWKISSVACGFSSIKIDYSDYLKSLISRINEVYVYRIMFIIYRKNINFISAVCFVAITLVIVLTWFL